MMGERGRRKTLGENVEARSAAQDVQTVICVVWADDTCSVTWQIASGGTWTLYLVRKTR